MIWAALLVRTQEWRRALEGRQSSPLAVALEPYLVATEALEKKLPWKVRWAIFTTGYIPLDTKLGPPHAE